MEKDTLIWLIHDKLLSIPIFFEFEINQIMETIIYFDIEKLEKFYAELLKIEENFNKNKDKFIDKIENYVKQVDNKIYENEQKIIKKIIQKAEIKDKTIDNSLDIIDY